MLGQVCQVSAMTGEIVSLIRIFCLSMIACKTDQAGVFLHTCCWDVRHSRNNNQTKNSSSSSAFPAMLDFQSGE